MINQIKIGKFIAQMRKEKELTQRQLAEQVGVSDKTVSKWETGRSMPDNSVIMDVCMVLEISVNELLLGERISEENYVNKAEENMIELVKESERQRKKGNWSVIGMIFGIAILSFACLVVILSMGGIAAISLFMDMPSLLFTIGITMLVLVASGMLGDFCMGFAIVFGKAECSKEVMRDAWCAMKTVLFTLPLTGVFIFVVYFVGIMAMLDKLEMIIPNLAVAMLSMFYSVLFEVFLVPIAVRLHKKINIEAE